MHAVFGMRLIEVRTIEVEHLDDEGSGSSRIISKTPIPVLGFSQQSAHPYDL